jgi:hypothetical protein
VNPAARSIRVDSKPSECPTCHEPVLIIQGFYRFGVLRDVFLWCPLCQGLNEMREVGLE